MPDFLPTASAFERGAVADRIASRRQLNESLYTHSFRRLSEPVCWQSPPPVQATLQADWSTVDDYCRAQLQSETAGSSQLRSRMSESGIDASAFGEFPGLRNLTDRLRENSVALPRALRTSLASVAAGSLTCGIRTAGDEASGLAVLPQPPLRPWSDAHTIEVAAWQVVGERSIMEFRSEADSNGFVIVDSPTLAAAVSRNATAIAVGEWDRMTLDDCERILSRMEAAGASQLRSLCLAGGRREMAMQDAIALFRHASRRVDVECHVLPESDKPIPVRLERWTTAERTVTCPVDPPFSTCRLQSDWASVRPVLDRLPTPQSRRRNERYAADAFESIGSSLPANLQLFETCYQEQFDRLVASYARVVVITRMTLTEWRRQIAGAWSGGESARESDARARLDAIEHRVRVISSRRGFPNETALQLAIGSEPRTAVLFAERPVGPHWRRQTWQRLLRELAERIDADLFAMAAQTDRPRHSQLSSEVVRAVDHTLATATPSEVVT